MFTTAVAEALELVARALDVLDADPNRDEVEIVAMLLRDARDVLDERARA